MPGEGTQKGPFPVRPPASTRRPALAAGAARVVHRQPTGSGLGPPCPALKANPFPEICIDGRSAWARTLGFAVTTAPSYSSGPGTCPDGQGRSAVHPLGDPANQLPYALRVYSSVDSHTCQTPWFVFQDGPNGEPAGRCQEHAVPRHATRARAASHDRGDDMSTSISTAMAWAATAIRVGPRPESISGPAHRRSTSNRDASSAPIRFPLGNYKHSLTLFSKSFSSFPHGTCSLSVSRQYLALDEIYRPIWAAFSNNPTSRQRLVVRQGPCTTGLSPSLAPPSRGLGLGLSLRTLLQTTIRTPRATDFHSGLFPVCSQLLGESLLVSFPPLIDMLKFSE
ncbi:hypothetical protein L6164_026119 [Bauhinia variegata]|uniref:Uncharacterized protein n=1 Tax=Bauhinia variegata TaxID=167791 RepID=A0ACB9LP07_BAUVA|nr:hypothetical protein L6164_026119 [Bauhinia variegata]